MRPCVFVLPTFLNTLKIIQRLRGLTYKNKIVKWRFNLKFASSHCIGLHSDPKRQKQLLFLHYSWEGQEWRGQWFALGHVGTDSCSPEEGRSRSWPSGCANRLPSWLLRSPNEDEYSPDPCRVPPHNTYLYLPFLLSTSKFQKKFH